MRDHRLYLKDILEAINSIENFVEGISLERFCNDDKTTSAVVRKLEIIGEATKNIPIEFKDRHPQIPWKEMAGMRDKLIHAYFVVDQPLVWDTIKNRLPHLKSVIVDILSSH